VWLFGVDQRSLASRLAVLALFFAVPAHAAPPAGLPEPGAADAAALAAANAEVGPAFKAGQWETVLDLGKRAYAAGGGADALETIAVAALRLGHATLAFGAYDAIIADPDAPAKTVGRAQNQLKALKAQVATIEVTTTPEGAAVEIRGRSAGTTPLTEPLRAFPGKVEIAAVFRDGSRVARVVDARAGATARVDLVRPDADAPVAVVASQTPVAPPAPAPATVPPAPAPATVPSGPAPATVPPAPAPATVPPAPAPATVPPAPAPAPATPAPAPAPRAIEPPPELDVQKPGPWSTHAGWNLVYGADALVGGHFSDSDTVDTSSVCDAGGTRTETRRPVTGTDFGAGAGAGGHLGAAYFGFEGDGPTDLFWGVRATLGVDALALGHQRTKAHARSLGDCALVEATPSTGFAYLVEAPLTLGALVGVGDGGGRWRGLLLGLGVAPTFVYMGGGAEHLGFNPFGVELSVSHTIPRGDDAGDTLGGLRFSLLALPGLIADAPWSFSLRGGWHWAR
jgi:hypothetical protein